MSQILPLMGDSTFESITLKDTCGTTEFYVTVSFSHGTAQPNRIFFVVAKEGSTLAGLCDALASTISVALACGVLWEAIAPIYLHTRFDPAGMSLAGDEEYPSLVHGFARAIEKGIKCRKEFLMSHPSS